MSQFVFVIKVLQKMTYFRCLQPVEKLPISVRSFQTANGTNGKVNIRTTGKTLNVPTEFFELPLSIVLSKLFCESFQTASLSLSLFGKLLNTYDFISCT